MFWEKVDLEEYCGDEGDIIRPDTGWMKTNLLGEWIPGEESSQAADLSNHRRTWTVYFHQMHERALKDNRVMIILTLITQFTDYVGALLGLSSSHRIVWTFCV